MSDMSDKMSGKAKEMAGKATNNKTQELKGKAQQDLADMKQKAKHMGHDMSDKLHHE